LPIGAPLLSLQNDLVGEAHDSVNAMNCGSTPDSVEKLARDIGQACADQMGSMSMTATSAVLRLSG